MTIETIGTPELWLGFTGFVLVLLALDLGLFHRKVHEVSMREALCWSMVWVGLALGFMVAVGFWLQRGTKRRVSRWVSDRESPRRR